MSGQCDVLCVVEPNVVATALPTRKSLVQVVRPEASLARGCELLFGQLLQLDD